MPGRDTGSYDSDARTLEHVIPFRERHAPERLVDNEQEIFTLFERCSEEFGKDLTLESLDMHFSNLVGALKKSELAKADAQVGLIEIELKVLKSRIETDKLLSTAYGLTNEKKSRINKRAAAFQSLFDNLRTALSQVRYFIGGDIRRPEEVELASGIRIDGEPPAAEEEAA